MSKTSHQILVIKKAKKGVKDGPVCVSVGEGWVQDPERGSLDTTKREDYLIYPVIIF